jgi:hypothetical protein
MTTSPSKTPEPRPFILDFDGTITTKDTICTLAKLAISHQASKGLDLQPAWDTIIAKYSEDFSNHVEKYRPTKEERRTLKQEIEYYRSLKEIETKSFERVSASGIFKGIGAGDVPTEREQYSAIIDGILASADLQKISARQIRARLAAQPGVDLANSKVCFVLEEC